MSEPERHGEREPVLGGEVLHCVPCPAPAIDGLAPVADEYPLGVVLVVDDASDDGVGVLCLVQKDVVVLVQPRVGQSPDLEVAVVGDPKLPVNRGDVFPCASGEWHDDRCEQRPSGGLVESRKVGNVLGRRLGIG